MKTIDVARPTPFPLLAIEDFATEDLGIEPRSRMGSGGRGWDDGTCNAHNAPTHAARGTSPHAECTMHKRDAAGPSPSRPTRWRTAHGPMIAPDAPHGTRHA